MPVHSCVLLYKTMKQPKHIDIIARLKNATDNDSRVFEYVFDQFYKPLNYFALGLTDDTEEAKDIVLETFKKFWAIRQNFDTVTNIKAFLYITTRNACLNFLNYRKRQIQNKKEYADFITDDMEADAENLMIRSEVLQELHEEINKLPPRCKQVVQLTLKGLKTDEIAGMMHVSPLTIYSQKRRALELLRTALVKKRLLVIFLFLMR